MMLKTPYFLHEFPMYRFLVKSVRALLLLSLLLLREETLIAGLRVYEAEGVANLAGEKAFAEAEQLRAEQNEISLRTALEKYREALLYWRAQNEKAKEAQAAARIGEIHVLFGENQAALSHYQQALKLGRQVKNTPLQIESLNRLCSIYAFQGDTARAFDYCNKALRLSRDTADRRGEAQALNNIGEAQSFTDMRKALALFQQASALLKGKEDQRLQAHTLTNIGYIYTDWSDLQEAATYYNQALAIWSVTGDLSGEARTTNALGVLHSKLGEKQKALNEHTRARELFRTIGNRPGELTALTGLGYVYDSMSQKEKALEQYTQALTISRAVGQREGEMVLLIHVGNVNNFMGKKEDARASYEEALNLSRVLGDTRVQAYCLTFLGEIFEADRNQKEALAYYKRALLLSRRSEDKRGEASVLNHLGHINEHSGRRELALKQYKSALALHLASKDRQGEALTRYNMASAFRALGDLEQARQEIETSLRIIESLRSDVGSHDLRVSYFASVQQYYSFYIDMLMQKHKADPANGFEVAAFQASERARARNLLDMLLESRADIYQSVEPVLKEKEHTLQQTLSAKSERQMRLLGGGKYSAEEAAGLEKEIGDLTFELENVRAQIRERSPRYTALTEPQPLSLKNVQDMLDENTLLLEYALGKERSYLWAVEKTGINTYELPEREKIEESAQRLYGLLTARQLKREESLAEYEARVKETDEQYWPQALELGKIILGPISGQLGTKRLLIVADGALLLVPFSALASSTSSDNQSGPAPVPLMLEHDIVNLPSASTLAVLRSMTANRQPATKAVAVLADPVYERDDPRLEAKANGTPTVNQTDVDLSLIDTGSGIARLLASAEEAEIVQMVPRGAGLKALGFDANLDTVRSPALAQYRIVHFATHGIFNNEHAELSAIILSLYDKEARPRAGFLRLQEIYNLNLPVDLVVLSACDTARGKEIDGEGLIGLTRGFMNAGAERVVASLWKVDEDATAELMKYFYAGVLQEGLAPATALRKAQIKMWQIKRRHPPYYWAAFVLHGEYRPSPVTAPRGPTCAQITAAGLSIVLALFGGIYVLRRRKKLRLTTLS